MMELLSGTWMANEYVSNIANLDVSKGLQLNDLVYIAVIILSLSRGTVVLAFVFQYKPLIP